MTFFEVKNLVKYFGGLAAVNEVSFQVKAGEIFGLIGPNGSGKTTIFNLISKYHRPTQGKILFKEKDITALKTHQICRLGIARTFQVVRPLGRMSVLDNVIAASFSVSQSKQEARDLALQTLEFCGLHHRKDILAKSLPLEERKRLEITRALATKPELLLLDETAAGLTPSELDGAIKLIKAVRDRGISIIIVEHIMKVIMSICDRVHVINFGQTVAEGTPTEVAANPGVIRAYLGEDYAQSRGD